MHLNRPCLQIIQCYTPKFANLFACFNTYESVRLAGLNTAKRRHPLVCEIHTFVTVGLKRNGGGSVRGQTSLAVMSKQNASACAGELIFVAGSNICDVIFRKATH